MSDTSVALDLLIADLSYAKTIPYPQNLEVYSHANRTLQTLRIRLSTLGAKGLTTTYFSEVDERVGNDLAKQVLDYQNYVNKAYQLASTKFHRLFIEATHNRRANLEGLFDETRNGLLEIIGSDGKTRRYSLSHYVKLIGSVADKQVASLAVISRARQGKGLVKVVGPNSRDKVCNFHNGKTFSVAGDERYPQLEVAPPFHPFCRHTLVEV